MYVNQTAEQSACFDPNNMILQQQPSDHHHHNHHHHGLNPSIDELDLQTQNSHLGISPTQPNNWIPTSDSQMGHFPNFHESSSITDLLTTLQLPNSNQPPSSSSMGFLGLVDHHDPLFHLNLPTSHQQSSPSLRDLFIQQGYSDGNDHRNHDHNMFGICGLENVTNGYGVSGLYHDQHHDHDQNHNHNVMHDGGNGIFEFSSGNPSLDKGKEGKCPKNFVTEQQRRQNFSDKYQHLKSLVPNPTKGDRASIVKDAIDYIMELKRTVTELKLLVEKKRITKERHKRLKNHEDKSSINAGENDQVHGMDGPVVVKPDPDQDFDGLASTQLRSSWLQRKCKDTEVDVRIVDDEVTIKLVQRKKINCLLSVSRTLDELQLDLRHVAGGHVGDYYSYLFNSKICEGSSVYASAIANKLIEVVERQYASASVTLQPTSSF